jgi:hypothetical protein
LENDLPIVVSSWSSLTRSNGARLPTGRRAPEMRLAEVYEWHEVIFKTQVSIGNIVLMIGQLTQHFRQTHWKAQSKIASYNQFRLSVLTSVRQAPSSHQGRGITITCPKRLCEKSLAVLLAFAGLPIKREKEKTNDAMW